MANLGSFRRDFDDVRLKLRSSKPINQASISVGITYVGDPGETPVPMSVDVDSDGIEDNEFVSNANLDLDGKPFGEAQLTGQATDLSNQTTQISDTLKVINAYGKSYGNDYGNGL